MVTARLLATGFIRHNCLNEGEWNTTEKGCNESCYKVYVWHWYRQRIILHDNARPLTNLAEIELTISTF